MDVMSHAHGNFQMLAFFAVVGMTTFLVIADEAAAREISPLNFTPGRVTCILWGVCAYQLSNGEWMALFLSVMSAILGAGLGLLYVVMFQIFDHDE